MALLTVEMSPLKLRLGEVERMWTVRAPLALQMVSLAVCGGGVVDEVVPAVDPDADPSS